MYVYRLYMYVVPLQLTVKPNVTFLALARTASTLNSWVNSIKEHLKDVNVSQTCVLTEKKFILARIGLIEDYEGRNLTMSLKYRAPLGVRFRPSGS